MKNKEEFKLSKKQKTYYGNKDSNYYLEEAQKEFIKILKEQLGSGVEERFKSFI
jgi:hypothetical protein